MASPFSCQLFGFEVTYTISHVYFVSIKLFVGSTSNNEMITAKRFSPLFQRRNCLSWRIFIFLWQNEFCQEFSVCVEPTEYIPFVVCSANWVILRVNEPRTFDLISMISGVNHNFQPEKPQANRNSIRGCVALASNVNSLHSGEPVDEFPQFFFVVAVRSRIQ